MSDTKTVKITVNHGENEAWHLAQFLKRASFSTCEQYSDPTDTEAPHAMNAAFGKVRRALAEVGIAPR